MGLKSNTRLTLGTMLNVLSLPGCCSQILWWDQAKLSNIPTPFTDPFGPKKRWEDLSLDKIPWILIQFNTALSVSAKSVAGSLSQPWNEKIHTLLFSWFLAKMNPLFRAGAENGALIPWNAFHGMESCLPHIQEQPGNAVHGGKRLCRAKWDVGMFYPG